MKKILSIILACSIMAVPLTSYACFAAEGSDTVTEETILKVEQQLEKELSEKETQGAKQEDSGYMSKIYKAVIAAGAVALVATGSGLAYNYFSGSAGVLPLSQDTPTVPENVEVKPVGNCTAGYFSDSSDSKRYPIDEGQCFVKQNHNLTKFTQISGYKCKRNIDLETKNIWASPRTVANTSCGGINLLT